ncbi:MAG: hypothetical protein IPH35_18515 [Rhodoferax sp.]|nr:hypothetical protein [Rhodoferax sp.]
MQQVQGREGRIGVFEKTQNKDGLDSRYKACLREYWQTDAYKERCMKYMKEYRQTDAFKEKHSEYRKAYRQTDAYKEKNREYMQAYRLRKKAAASAGKATPSRSLSGLT